MLKCLAAKSPLDGLQLTKIEQILAVCTEPNKARFAQAFLKWAKKEWQARDYAECLQFLDEQKYAARDTQIFVKNHYKQIMTICIWLGMKILTLKKIIHEKTGMPPEHQVLKYGGQWLQDSFSLQDFNIKECCTIDMSYKISEKIPKNLDLYPLLCKLCIDAIVSDFKKQSKTKGWLKLNSGTIKAIVERDNLHASKEMIVFKSIHSWVSVSAIRTGQLPNLIQHIRFPLMAFADLLLLLSDSPKKYPEIAACSTFGLLLQEAMLYKAATPDPTKTKPNIESTKIRERNRKS